MSYYATLGLDRSATTEDVKRTYRKCALKWHPERCDFTEAEATFQAVAESYDVLSHPARRAIYDQYGQHGLKEGIPDGNGGIKGGTYTFSKNAHEIFAAFFGTSRRARPDHPPAARRMPLSRRRAEPVSARRSPFSDILGDMGDEAPPFYGELTGMTLPKKPTKPEPVRTPRGGARPPAAVPHPPPTPAPPHSCASLSRSRCWSCTTARLRSFRTSGACSRTTGRARR